MKIDRKTKYRFWVIICLCLDLFMIVCLGYYFLNKKIPDKIFVLKDEKSQWEDFFEIPFLKSEIAIETTTGNEQLCNYLFEKIPLKKTEIIRAKESELFVSGNTVGIYMKADGVLIIDTGEIVSQLGMKEEPAKNIVQPGDYIIAMNDQKIRNKKELVEDLKALETDTVTLSLKRNGEIIPVSMNAVKDMEGSYKLGIWVRDDTQGIGTLTYITPTGSFGALGHGISDIDTGKILRITEGALYRTQILGILKGEKGSPGELSGLIRYDKNNIIGKIAGNTGNGIYGDFYLDVGKGIRMERMPVGYKQEMEIGEAEVFCSIGERVKGYAAQIVKIDMNHSDDNKSFVIQITDSELLEKTGGIVQGMSGAPVCQNGKIVGAITHVLVNDPTMGYGIFIENMLQPHGG